MTLVTIDRSLADPWESLEFAEGCEDLYFRSPETEEQSAVWVAAVDQHGLDPRDLPRVTAALSERWTCQTLEQDGVVLVVGRYRLLDEALRLRDSLESLPSVERHRLVEALSAARTLLGDLPDTWFISADIAAKQWGVTQRRMTQLITQGRVPGAHKRGRHWHVPSNFEVRNHPGRARRRPGES